MAKQTPKKPEPTRTSPAGAERLSAPRSPFRRFSTSCYEGFIDAFAIVEGIQESDPQLYRKIAAATNVSAPEIDAVVTLLLAETRLKSVTKRRRRNAFRLIYESMAVIEDSEWLEPPDEPQYDWTEENTASTKQRKAVFKLLVRSLRDADPQVRCWAVRSLTTYINHNDKEGQLDILRILAKDGITNDDPDTAEYAMIALDCMDRDIRSEAVPALISALNHSNERVRQLACWALRDLRDDSLEAVPALVRVVLHDGSEDIRLEAVKTLRRIIGFDSLVQRLRGAVSETSDLLTVLRKGGRRMRDLRQKLREQQLPAGEGRQSPDQNGSDTTQGYGSNTLAPPLRNESEKLDDAGTSNTGVDTADGNGTSGKIGRGRPHHSDPEADKKLAEQWKASGHRTIEDFAIKAGVTVKEVKLAIGRHRKR